MFMPDLDYNFSGGLAGMLGCERNPGCHNFVQSATLALEKSGHAFKNCCEQEDKSKPNIDVAMGIRID